MLEIGWEGGMVTIWCGEKLKEEQEDHVCC